MRLNPWNQTGEKRENPVGEEARCGTIRQTTNRKMEKEAWPSSKKKKKKEKKRDLAAIGEQMNALVRAIPSLSHRL